MQVTIVKQGSQVQQGPPGLPVIRNGFALRIRHDKTKQFLHSHKINYTSNHSSKLQEVTAHSPADENDWFFFWKISPGDDIIRDGDQLMIQHVTTASFVRSAYGFKSCNTEQQEVAAHPPLQVRHQDDMWFLLHEKDASDLHVEDKFRLLHRGTGAVLHSHDKKIKTGSKQQEVTGIYTRDDNDLWAVQDIKPHQ